ncbi:hypothetical protein GALMADRAFT_213561 [Galerina marginata CBS 339.88]|uniref:Uncharacterized protein n=1 Tax=Galerina marginata (strain CBS 339.88) TaxID=685588 RepID=A0A067SMJ1_GALM3|nr:hypothetical protein GALMADRAFT_213561 [Galerina marginata CBS 339.88]
MSNPLLPSLSQHEQESQYMADIDLIGRRDASNHSPILTYKDLIDTEDDNDEFSPYEQPSELSSDVSSDPDAMGTPYTVIRDSTASTHTLTIQNFEQISANQDIASSDNNSLASPHVVLTTNIPDLIPKAGALARLNGLEIPTFVGQIDSQPASLINPEFIENWSKGIPRQTAQSELLSPLESSSFADNYVLGTNVNTNTANSHDSIITTSPTPRISTPIPCSRQKQPCYVNTHEETTSQTITNDDILLSRRPLKKKTIPAEHLQTLKFSPITRFQHNPLPASDHAPKTDYIQHGRKKRKKSKHNYDTYSAETHQHHMAHRIGQKNPPEVSPEGGSQLPQPPQHSFTNTLPTEHQLPGNPVDYSVSVSSSGDEINGYSTVTPPELLPDNIAHTTQNTDAYNNTHAHIVDWNMGNFPSSRDAFADYTYLTNSTRHEEMTPLEWSNQTSIPPPTQMSGHSSEVSRVINLRGLTQSRLLSAQQPVAQTFPCNDQAVLVNSSANGVR